MRILFIILLNFLPPLHAQELKAVPGKEIALSADRFVGIDKFKNLYYISKQILFKKTPEKLYQFSDIQLGAISSVDLINPLRITVFYGEFNTALILDNTLNEITRVDFNRIEQFRNVSHARTASDRNLWIYNIDRQRLELYNYQNNTLTLNAPPLPQIASEMTSNFNKCWIYTNNSLKTYNIYGSLIADIETGKLSSLGEDHDNLWAIRQEDVVFKTRNATRFLKLDIAEKQIQDLYYADEILYIYTGKVLKTYTLNLPKK